jgi:hypothetical protein
MGGGIKGLMPPSEPIQSETEMTHSDVVAGESGVEFFVIHGLSAQIIAAIQQCWHVAHRSIESLWRPGGRCCRVMGSKDECLSFQN